MGDASNQVATNQPGEAQVQPNNGNAPNQRQPTRMESFFAITKSLMIRALVIYFITSFFRPSQVNKDPSIAAQPGASPGGSGAPARQLAWNIFREGAPIDLHVFVSEQESFTGFREPSALFWRQANLRYGDWKSGPRGDGTFMRRGQIAASQSLKSNGSIYLHAYVTVAGKSPDPEDGPELFAGEAMSYSRKMLNRFKKKRLLKTKNLLTGETEMSEEDKRKAEHMKEEILSHWHPNVTINLVADQTNWARGSVPQPLEEYIQFLPDGTKYKPVLFVNDFWNLLRDYEPINETTDVLELEITFQPLSLFKWQLYSAQTMRNKWASNILGEAFTYEEDDEDQDTLKETLLETSPYLLGVTILVSVLHSIFELLAFKNDIQFWNNRKSLEGLSVRSVFFNVFQSVVVLLFVLDNDINTIVRISCFVSLGIEVWKIHKVVDVRLDRSRPLLGLFPRLTFQDKGSYVESSTRQYDLMAFKYLSWLCFPLLAAYAVYSLIYLEHKGWYSFVLNMLYGFLLTFGFITMTPQLFINYKLKSVAHLPWRMMTYKFLNTFIDDIFAFVIKMPTMYRLGCFRDDIVFFIFLYQRWIYKVDASRVNEFGFSQEMEEQAKQQQNQANGQMAAIEPPPEPQPQLQPQETKKDK